MAVLLAAQANSCCAVAEKQDVLMQEPRAGVLRPSFCLIRDEQLQSIVLAVRGTHSLKVCPCPYAAVLLPYGAVLLPYHGVFLPCSVVIFSLWWCVFLTLTMP